MKPVADIGAAADVWLGELSRQGRAPDTVRKYREALYELATMYEHLALWDVELAHLRRFLDRRAHLSPSTQAGYVTVVKRFFAFCEEEEMIPANPARRLKRPALKSSEDLDVLTISKADVERLFAACEDFRELLCIATLAYLGPRLRAAAWVRRRDVNLERGTIRFREKGRKIATKRIPAEYEELIRTADTLGVWASDDDYLIPSLRKTDRAERHQRIVYRIVKTVAARAGVKTTVHALRAAFAVHYLEGHPGDLDALQNLMGHARTDTTRIYLRRFDRMKSMERVRDLSWGTMFPSIPGQASAGADSTRMRDPRLSLPEPLVRKLAELRQRTQSRERT